MWKHRLSQRTIFGTPAPPAYPSFRHRLLARKRLWSRPGRSELVTRIVRCADKMVMREFASRLDLRLPALHYAGRSLSGIDLAALDGPFVVKPSNSYSSDCVMIFSGDREVFSGTRVAPAERQSFVEACFARGRHTTAETLYLVEEFVRDIDPGFLIPRDFKVYAVGGRAWIVQVINRNGRMTSRCFFRDATPINDAIQKSYRHTDNIGAVPAGPFARLIEAAERLSKEMPPLLRFDFYLTPDGPVVGEFTRYPFDGRRFTPAGERAMCWLMDNFPDD